MAGVKGMASGAIKVSVGQKVTVKETGAKGTVKGFTFVKGEGRGRPTAFVTVAVAPNQKKVTFRVSELAAR